MSGTANTISNPQDLLAHFTSATHIVRDSEYIASNWEDKNLNNRIETNKKETKKKN